MELITDYRGRPAELPPETLALYPLKGGAFFASPCEGGLSYKGLLRRCRKKGITHFFLFEVVDPYYNLARVLRVNVGATRATTTRERVEVGDLF